MKTLHEVEALLTKHRGEFQITPCAIIRHTQYKCCPLVYIGFKETGIITFSDLRPYDAARALDIPESIAQDIVHGADHELMSRRKWLVSLLF